MELDPCEPVNTGQWKLTLRQSILSGLDCYFRSGLKGPNHWMLRGSCLSNLVVLLAYHLQVGRTIVSNPHPRWPVVWC